MAKDKQEGGMPINDPIILQVYDNIYERIDGKGLESYQTVKFGGKWVVGEEVSPTYKIPVAAKFKGNWDNVAALIKTITGRNIKVEYVRW